MNDESIGRFAHVELVGERVRLRPPRPNDALTAFEMFRDDRVTERLAWDGPTSVEEVEAWYADTRIPGARPSGALEYLFAIELRESPGILGSIGAVIQNEGQLALGYWLGVPHWGKGLMTEALRLFSHFAFHHLDTARISARVFVDNIGSRRVLMKNGFSLGGTMRHDVLKRGEWLDRCFFSLLGPEWEERREWYRPQQEDVR